MIVFCATGGHCSVPLHTLLTDYIEASGGSSELITVLNRLGAVASSETLDRHIVRVSAQRKQEGAVTIWWTGLLDWSTGLSENASGG